MSTHGISHGISRGLRLVAVGISGLLLGACDRVADDAPEVTALHGSTPAPKPKPGKSTAHNTTDVQKIAIGLIGDCARKGWIARHKVDNKGAAPTVGLVVTNWPADPTLDVEVIRRALTGALSKRGVRVVRRRRHPRVFAKDPSRSVRVVFSKGVRPSAQKRGVGPSAHKQEDFSLETRISRMGRPGPQNRYHVAISLVELKTSVEIWSSEPAHKRRRPTGVKLTLPQHRSCRARPGWINMVPCRLGGRAYGVDKTPFPGVRRYAASPVSAFQPLLKSLAGRHGGMAVVGFKQVEALDSYRCSPMLYVLISASFPRAALTLLPRCSKSQIAARSTLQAGCPAWTRGIAWRKGRRAHGVASQKVGSALSSSSYLRKKATEASRLVFGTKIEFTPHKSGYGLKRLGQGGRRNFVNERWQEASCDGRRFVLYTAQIAP